MRIEMVLIAIAFSTSALAQEWGAYGGDAGGSRFSTAKQIDRTNVSKLVVAWTHRTGDLSDGTRYRRSSKFEATPVLDEGTLYLSTPFNRVLALDAATGAERFAYDPGVDLDGRYSEGLVSRGVSLWRDARNPDGSCGRRVLLGTLDARLIALDAATGALCEEFGRRGVVDLTEGVGNLLDGEVERGEYQVTSPPAVLGHVVVVGSALGDNRGVALERGTVRAYDARSGELLWSFDPLVRSRGELTGAANAWSIFSADPVRDLVFVPTGSASPDFYGGERPGTNAHANSVVALRGSTGELVWHFQVVHHDLWDYDVASQPSLFELRRAGEVVPAVLVSTKMGHLFVLHRETGEPLLPIEERPVPESDVAGEKASRTQPFPVKPPPLHPHRLDSEDAWGIDERERAECRALLSGLRNEGIFTPPSVQGTLVYPGFFGGVNWGSAAVALDRGVAVVAVNELPYYVQLVRRDEYDDARKRAEGLSSESSDRRYGSQFTSQRGTPYGMARRSLISSSGLPCSPPPWSRLVAVDLNAGEVLWDVPLGIVPALADRPEAAKWGSAVLGGPIVTASGLVFVAGTLDDALRAFDLETGEELWKAPLPAGGQATPMTYVLGGKQYVVVAAGGHGGAGTTLGDHVVAFTLP